MSAIATNYNSCISLQYSYLQMIPLFLLIISVFAEQPLQQKEIEIVLTEFASELKDWIGFENGVLAAAQQCKLSDVEQNILELHKKLSEAGESFSRTHIDVIRNYFKQHAQVKDFLKCLVEKRNTQNKYVSEKKKYKYLAQFIKDFPRYSEEAFHVNDKPFDKGYRLGRFFKAFFEWYYQFILNPAETVSTRLIRFITTKTDVFNHEDISPCLDIETSGKISDSLQNLGINNIYINIPEAFDALKFLKLKYNKEGCRSEKYLKYVTNLTDRISKIDLFKVMYHDYQGFVEIAAQKYGNFQIQAIAQIFARIINNPKKYIQISQLSEEEL